MFIVHNIYSAFDAYPTLESRGVFLDMSKAFDKVWHEGLIFKLKSMVILDTLLELIKSFFNNQVPESCTEWSDIRVVTGKIRYTTRMHFRSTLFSNIH